VELRSLRAEPVLGFAHSRHELEREVEEQDAGRDQVLPVHFAPFAKHV